MHGDQIKWGVAEFIKGGNLRGYSSRPSPCHGSRSKIDAEYLPAVLVQPLGIGAFPAADIQRGTSPTTPAQRSDSAPPFPARWAQTRGGLDANVPARRSPSSKTSPAAAAVG